MKLKWGIRLRSKYTGEAIVLGSKYDSYEEAKKESEIIVCPRCNYVDIISFPKDFEWVDKNKGFKDCSQKSKRGAD